MAIYDTVRNIPRQNSPDSLVTRLTPCRDSIYSKPPHWPVYMPPTPPIAHEYYAPSAEMPCCSLSSFNSHRKRRVRFSDNVCVRIIFGGIDEGHQDLIIDTQLVDVLRFGPVLALVPSVLWLLHSPCSWMSCSLGTFVRRRGTVVSVSGFKPLLWQFELNYSLVHPNTKDTRSRSYTIEVKNNNEFQRNLS